MAATKIHDGSYHRGVVVFHFVTTIREHFPISDSSLSAQRFFKKYELVTGSRIDGIVGVREAVVQLCPM